MKNFSNYQYQKRKFHRLIKNFPKAEKIKEAFLFAERYHRGQKRTQESGAPYFIHPLRCVNYLIVRLREKKPEVLIAALFHDVVEDTDCSIADIKKRFGVRAARTSISQPLQPPVLR